LIRRGAGAGHDLYGVSKMQGLAKLPRIFASSGSYIILRCSYFCSYVQERDQRVRQGPPWSRSGLRLAALWRYPYLHLAQCGVLYNVLLPLTEHHQCIDGSAAVLNPLVLAVYAPTVALMACTLPTVATIEFAAPSSGISGWLLHAGPEWAKAHEQS
jgi:hypothetical protein